MSVQIARRYFTVDEYHRMGEAGIFLRNEHVELIEGEILKKNPIGSRHVASVNRLHMQLSSLFAIAQLSAYTILSCSMTFLNPNRILPY